MVPWPILFFSGSRRSSDLHETFSGDGTLAFPVFAGSLRCSDQHETFSGDGILAVPVDSGSRRRSDQHGLRGRRRSSRGQACAGLKTRGVVLTVLLVHLRPHRRVISRDSDLNALGVSISSTSDPARVSVSRVSGELSASCSRCGRAIVCESGALCRVCVEGARQSVVSSGHKSWKGVEPKFAVQGRVFLRRYCWNSIYEGRQKERKWRRGKVAFFTCSRPTSWDVSVAEGCKVTVSAVYLPEKRPGLLAAGPLYRILLGWSRLLYTTSSGIWIFRGALRGSQVLPALVSCFDCTVRGTCRTAWAVQPCCRIFVWERTCSWAANLGELGVSSGFVEGSRTLDCALVR